MLKADPCCYCKDEKTTTIDHIEPKALGGSKGSWTNRTGSCFRCNQDKAHTPLLFFMLERQGVDISFLKDEDGNWPIPEVVEERHPVPIPEPLQEAPRPHELINLAKWQEYRKRDDEDFRKAA